MMKRLIAIILIFALISAPTIALAASSIVNARYFGVIQISNNSTAETFVATTCGSSINTTNLIAGGYLNAGATNAVVRSSSGADLPFMPGYEPGGYPWSLWVPSIGDYGYLSDILYTANSSGGKIRYFPGTGGMTTPDNDATLELGDNFTVEQKGRVTTTFTDNYSDRNLVFKDAAFKTYVSGAENITSIIYNASSNNTTLLPNAAGYYTNIEEQFPASTFHWDKVDDPVGAHDSSTTTVKTNETVQEKDAYNVEDGTISSTSIVNSANVTFSFAANNASGTAYCQPFLRLNGSETAGTERSVAGIAFTTFSETLARPGGGSWLPSDIPDLQVAIGLRIDNASYKAECTQVYIFIDYTAPAASVTATGVSSGEHTVKTVQGASTDNSTYYYSLSEPWVTISGDPTNRHNFQPVHTSNITELNLTIDGAPRKYLAYDSDNPGTEIRLYYTDDLDGQWTAYSGNPILGPSTSHYRWPSVVWQSDNSTLHMFLSDRTDTEIERWTSVDGINFSFSENVSQDERILALTTGMLSGSGLKSFNPAQLIDDNTATNGFYLPEDSSGQWLRIDFSDTPRNLGKWRLYHVGAGWSTVWNVQYSDDASDWTTTSANWTTGADAGWYEVTWNAAGYHRYWQILTVSTGAGNWYYSEMAVAEYAESDYMNPFVWQNPNDDEWYLYHQEQGPGYPNRLYVRHSENITDLVSATDVKIYDWGGSHPGRTASPSVMYRDGRYWLLVEDTAPGGSWAIWALYSSSPDSGFVIAPNSPILGEGIDIGHACPIHLLSPDGTTAYLYTTTNVDGNWRQRSWQLYPTDTVETLRPNGAGSETSIQDVSGAATHWEAVDEVVADNTTTNVWQSAVTTGVRDLYALSNHSINGTIRELIVSMRVHPGGTSANGYFKSSLKTHGAIYDGIQRRTQYLYDWVTFWESWETNPYTGKAWTWEEVDNLEAGLVMIVPYGTGYARCTQLYVQIVVANTLSLYVDDVLKDNKYVAVTVPNNDNNWAFLENDVMPYMEYQKIWIDGVLRQHIVWEYGTTFTDLSGNSNPATPSFRSASSDPHISAELISFQPVSEARAPDYVLGEAPAFIDPAITGNVTGTFTTTPGTGAFPLANVIAEIAAATDTPPQLPLLIIACFVLLAASLSVSATMRRYGSGSILVKTLVIAAIMGIFVALGNFAIDFWMIVVFLIIAISLCFASKQLGWS